MKRLISDGQTLKKQIKDVVESSQLSDEQTNSLLDLQRQNINESASFWYEPIFKSVLSAGVCLVLIFSFWYGVYVNDDVDFENQRKVIALEVISNHLKAKPLEVKTQSFDELQAYFTQLDFMPVAPAVLPGASRVDELILGGGRYCSIQGSTAAQIRYLNNQTKVATLYEVDYHADKYGPMPSVEEGEKAESLVMKGLEVTFWREKGLLMVLVTEIN